MLYKSWCIQTAVCTLAIKYSNAKRYITLSCLDTQSTHGWYLFYTDVYKPSLSYVGRFGGVLLTYIASAMLHVCSELKCRVEMKWTYSVTQYNAGTQLSTCSCTIVNRNLCLH